MLSDKYNYLLFTGNQRIIDISINSEEESFFISDIKCISNILLKKP